METSYLTLEDLALRWKRTPRTAREYTRHAGFPPVLALSGRTLRWDEAEVAAWESELKQETKRTYRPKPVRKAGSALPMPAQVRRAA